MEAVKAALPYMTLGPPLLHPGPGGIHVDVPLMYQGFALDRIHYDPVSGEPRPKGMPVHAPGLPEGFRVRDFLRELCVVEAVEYREPERAWIVPLRWRVYIVAHVRVSEDGSELIPDYPLTEEVMRRVV
ncbi:MAG: hypothetical protein GXO09_04405 [Crenarchaeota archaeon]|nr:hypothetical protein [Thermoproteota archaeon]